jgi:hypothetical protein
MIFFDDDAGNPAKRQIERERHSHRTRSRD